MGAHGFTADQGQLAGVVSGVRNRWRLKRALHGATITVAVAFVVLCLFPGWRWLWGWRRPNGYETPDIGNRTGWC